MIERNLHHKLKEYLAVFPAVALLGARQIGKTTLALNATNSLDFANHIDPSDSMKNPLYIDFERPSDFAKFENPEFFLQQHNDRLLILDEVQRMPKLFEILRSVIDERRRHGTKNGQYLLLGSASKELLQQSSESLAGRIIYTELSGFNLLEINHDQKDRLWLQGGFPDSFLAKSPQTSYMWRESLIQTYLTREIPLFGPKIESETLRRFWTMLAHCQGELMNQARIAASLGVSNPTIGRYLDLLVDLFMVRVLRPWASNVSKRLVKTPKVYIRDTGLLHCLLGIKSMDDLLSNPVAGGSFEGFVIENIASVVGPGVSLYFYRTAAGAEVDLVIELSPTKIIAIEIKFSLSPKISKGLYEGIETLKPYKTYIVYGGNDRYRLSDQIEVMSLPHVLEELRELA
jgi:predicted AAA+ superfamily ATPase